MGRGVVLLATVGVGVALGAMIASSGDGDDDGDDERREPAPAGADAKERCPTPRITGLTVRSAGKDGYRVQVRMRAEVERGGIGSLHVTFSKRAAAILDIFGRRRVSVATGYTYSRPGTYLISVVAESSTAGCRRLNESPPATLRVRVPVTPRAAS